jgi:hypothetical protein
MKFLAVILVVGAAVFALSAAFGSSLPRGAVPIPGGAGAGSPSASQPGAGRISA